MSNQPKQQQEQPQAPPPKPSYGIVKQVNSGDSITIRAHMKSLSLPSEKTIILSNIIAPKIGRRNVNQDIETKDDPYGWEAREFLRKKLIGENVIFIEEKSPNNTRIYGKIWLGTDMNAPSMAELLVMEGLVSVKKDQRVQSPELIKLQELEEAAKSAGKGKWSSSPITEHVRDVKYQIENPLSLIDKYGGKPVDAIIEHVRDGSTVKVLLIPDFYHITLAISGIRCPPCKQDETDPIAKQAKFFVESGLLQRDIKVILESANNTQFVGSILHPNGNIAEALLSKGLARCVDWSMNHIKTDKHKLYLAEKAAKEQRLNIWKDFVPARPSEELSGTVVEITSADSMKIRLNNGEEKKIFLSSIRPPPRKDKPVAGEDGKIIRAKDFRPLYDIPWMFEAREFLRKKLIGKPVKVVIDYVQPARDEFKEKTCCTVTVGKVNIAEAMVSKGLATVVRYRQNDDQRSSHYNDLLVAESKAEKSGYGLHAKKDVPMQRIRDVSTDPTAAKSHLQSLKRAREMKAVVEYTTSGSRLKLFVPKEYCLITFLLAGVKCPRASRQTQGGSGNMEAEPFGDEALAFTKKLCFQKDVDIQIENMESKGSGFIGWLHIDGVNLSVALVEEGLAEVSNFVEQGEHLKTLKAAEERAKAKKIGIWKDHVEIEVEPEVKEREEQERGPAERKVDYQEVVVSEVTDELHVYTQRVDQKNALESMLTRLRADIAANPPLAGAYTPKKGELAIAKFTEDDEWYRVRIEKVTGSSVHVFYIDYGNREVIQSTRVAALPAGFNTDKPFATENLLALVTLPKDEDDKKSAVNAFREDTITGKPLLLNIENRNAGVPVITLVDPTTQEDIVKALIADGFLHCTALKGRRLRELRDEYKKAEKEARDNHRNIWQYGDVTEDDAKEFGIGR